MCVSLPNEHKVCGELEASDGYTIQMQLKHESLAALYSVCNGSLSSSIACVSLYTLNIYSTMHHIPISIKSDLNVRAGKQNFRLESFHHVRYNLPLICGNKLRNQLNVDANLTSPGISMAAMCVCVRMRSLSNHPANRMDKATPNPDTQNIL